MARLNGDKVYRITKSINGNTIQLDFFASDNTAVLPSTPTVVNLNNECLENIVISAEFDGLAVGLASLPVMELQINVNKSDTAFNRLLRDPFRTYTVSTSMPSDVYITGSGIAPMTFEVVTGNVWSLSINGVLSFVGFQKTSLENNFDSETFLQTIEVWHSARVVMENIPMTVCNQLVAYKTDSDNIRQSQVAYDYIFKDTGLIGDINVFCQGGTPDLKDYFYFIKRNVLYTHLNVVYNQTIKRITRDKYQDISDPLPNFDNIELFEQSYTKELGRGVDSVMCNDASVYILAFTTNQPLSNRVNGVFDVYESFVSKLENYKTVYDFYVALSKQHLVRVYGKVNGLYYDDLFTSVTLDINSANITEYPTLELDYKVLRRVETACVEKYDNDVDKYEMIFAGSRSANADNLTAVYNQNIAIRKGVGDNSAFIGGLSKYSDRFKLFKVNNVARAFIIRHFSPLFLSYYYFDIPNVSGDNLTSETVAIRFNHNINILFGNGYHSDEFNSEITISNYANITNKWFIFNVMYGAYLDLANRSGGSLQTFSNAFLTLYKAYNDNTNVTTQQCKLNVAISPNVPFIREFANGYLHRNSFDIDTLAPPNDSDYFSNVITEFYTVKYNLDLNLKSENGHKYLVEIETVARSYGL